MYRSKHKHFTLCDVVSGKARETRISDGCTYNRKKILNIRMSLYSVAILNGANHFMRFVNDLATGLIRFNLIWLQLHTRIVVLTYVKLLSSRELVIGAF